MPDEPSTPHPLEAALRAQAERRRVELDAGRTPELPGPVRAALLREVDRRAAPAKEGRIRPMPWWWRWQTLLATSACVLLAIGIFRRETRSPSTTADQASAPAAAASPSVADRPESPAPAEERRARERARAPEPAAPRDEGTPAASPPPSAVVPPSGAADGTFAERPVPPANEQPAAQPPPAAPIIRLEPPPGRPIAAAPAAPAATSDALLGGAAKPAPAASQRFLQTPLQQTKRAAQSVGSSPVLTDFTLRREGDTLVIRERDGSEYRAPLAADKREATSTDAFKKDASRRSIAANESPAPRSEPVPFRATGVNNTLKQTVVIEGILQPAAAESSLSEAPPLARSKTAAPAPAKPSQAGAVRAAAPSRASIQGRAIISGKEYAVEAEEAGPPPSTR